MKIKIAAVSVLAAILTACDYPVDNIDSDVVMEPEIAVVYSDDVLVGYTGSHTDRCGGKYLYDQDGSVVGYLREDLRVGYIEISDPQTEYLVGTDLGNCTMDGTDVCRLRIASTWRDPIIIPATDENLSWWGSVSRPTMIIDARCLR